MPRFSASMSSGARRRERLFFEFRRRSDGRWACRGNDSAAKRSVKGSSATMTPSRMRRQPMSARRAAGPGPSQRSARSSGPAARARRLICDIPRRRPWEARTAGESEARAHLAQRRRHLHRGAEAHGEVVAVLQGEFCRRARCSGVAHRPRTEGSCSKRGTSTDPPFGEAFGVGGDREVGAEPRLRLQHPASFGVHGDGVKG